MRWVPRLGPQNSQYERTPLTWGLLRDCSLNNLINVGA